MQRVLCAIGLVVLSAVSGAQSLRGSRASVDLMYTRAHARDLAFLKTPADIYEAARLGDLRLLTVTEDLALDKVAFPFVLPNTHRFVDSLAAVYHAACGQRLIVTSGSRPLDRQPRNASPKSVHPTGMAVDFRKPAGACLAWLRTNLLALEDRHVIEATEEHHPPHFHVAVLNQLPERRATILASAAPTVSTGAVPKAQTAAGEVAGPAAKSGAKTPSSGPYRVRAGDNLSSIAQQHGTTVDEIKTLNGLHSTRLRVGQQLRLP